jgi:hypothetical protein
MKQDRKPIFFGLLYVDDTQTKNANIRGGGDQLDIYLRCAVLCAKSLAYHGYRFRLATNVKHRIERRIEQLRLPKLDVFEQEFSLNVPANIQFRAAHFKLELYRCLGTRQFGQHIAVIDIDSVMVSPIEVPPLLPGTIILYDITKQIVEEYGDDRVRLDLERVSGVHPSEWRWFGGEFLLGHADSFKMLGESIVRLWPKYIEYVHELHHVGDEMIVSAAMLGAGLKLLEAGECGFVARWWTARTNFKQSAFDAAAKRSILHLPADKTFLADRGDSPFFPKEFIGRFRRMARQKLFIRKLLNVMERSLGRRPKYVGHLSD